MDLIEQLNGLVSSDAMNWIVIAFIGSQVLGRAYTAVVKGGGLKSIVSAIWLGTNTPKDTE
jgi:hypothetical protein